MGRRAARVANLDYYREHFLEAIGEDRVVCLECGGAYRALGTHVLLRHHLGLNDYRTRWGYNRKQSLLARDLVPGFRAQALVRGFLEYGTKTEAWKKGHASIARRGPFSASKQFRLMLSQRERGRAVPSLQKVPDAVLLGLEGEGQGATQIAQRVGMSPASVRQRLRRIHGREAVAAERESQSAISSISTLEKSSQAFTDSHEPKN